jgi:hypothetical protein
MARRFAAFLIALALPDAAAVAQVYVEGPDIRINDYTLSIQDSPAVAPTPDGGFVVAWRSVDQWIAGQDVYAQRHPPLFLPGHEFRVNSYTTGTQFEPAVAAAGNGTFVVVWTSVQDGSYGGVFGQRFDAAGARLGGEFQVNVHTTGAQSGPAVAADAAGGFIVVWRGSGPGDAEGVFARRYSASGVPQGGEFRVNGWTLGRQDVPSVAAAASGEFVVVWGSANQPPDGPNLGVFARRFSAAGDPQGPEFLVHSVTTLDEWRPAVAADMRGNFVVVWDRLYPVTGGQSRGVFGRAFDRFGFPFGPEFQANAFTTGYQWIPSVAVMSCGNFVVTWTSSEQDGANAGVFGRYFDDWGAEPGPEFPVNSYTTSVQTSPAVAAQPGGRLLPAWESVGQDGHSTGVFGRRFHTDLIFRDGFDSHDAAAWTGQSADGGDLSVSALAALRGTAAGLQAVVDDTAGLYVQDDSPQDETVYSARFYFDTNGFDPGEARGHRRVRLFVAFEENPLRRLTAVVLRRVNGAYGVMGRVRLADNSQADTGFFPISDGPHFIELAWERASSPGANNGSYWLWLDGLPVASLSGLDNSGSRIDFARLGALSVKPGGSGTLYLDEFESRRVNNIGP